MLSDNQYLKPIFVFFLSGRLRQVLLYMMPSIMEKDDPGRIFTEVNKNRLTHNLCFLNNGIRVPHKAYSCRGYPECTKYIPAENASEDVRQYIYIYR